MKVSPLRFSLLPALVLSLLAQVSCLQSDSGALPAVTGPFDGTYLLTARTCNGTSVTADGTISRLVVKGSQGTYSDLLADSCMIVTYATLSYPLAGVVTMTTQKVTCSTACSGSECSGTDSPLAQTQSTYVFRGSSLLLTQASSPSCTASEAAAFDRSP